MRDLATAELAHLILLQGGARAQLDPGAELFAIARVRHPKHLHVLHLRMAIEEFLDLAWIDVFATTNDHILDAPNDVTEPGLVEHGQIPGVHPARGINRLGRALRIVPVAQHHQIAARAQFSRRATWHDAAVRIHNLGLDMRMHPPDSGHAPLQRVLDRGLKTGRAGLRHAVANGDLAEMHGLNAAAHHFDGARGTGHHASAQTGEIKVGEIWMFQFCDEHGGHAIERGAALLRHGFQGGTRLKAFAWKDHSCTVRETGQIADHHAKTVIQRHRNTHFVLGREAHHLAQEKAIVQNVVVRQGGALGHAGRPRSELDVDWLVKLQRLSQCGQSRPLGRAAQCRHGFKPEHTGCSGAADLDHRLQPGQLRRAPVAGGGMRQFWRQGVQHAAIIAVLERRGSDQRPAAHLVQRIFQLRQTVCGVDVHQDEPGFGRSKLCHHPFGVVWRPDPHPVSWLEPQRQQPGGKGLDPSP